MAGITNGRLKTYIEAAFVLVAPFVLGAALDVVLRCFFAVGSCGDKTDE